MIVAFFIGYCGSGSRFVCRVICFNRVDVITWCLPFDQAHALIFAHVTLDNQVGGASAVASEELLNERKLIYLLM